MKDIQQIINNPHSELGYKPSQPQSKTLITPDREELIDEVWISLQNMGLISQKEMVDSPKYQTWARAMCTMTTNELKRGLKGAEDHVGWFSLGDFKKYCKSGGMSLSPIP